MPAWRIAIGGLMVCLALAGCSNAVPGPTSTPTVSADVPAPADLGQGWTADDSPEGGDHVEAGDAGGWLSERQPDELLLGLAPLGCPQAAGPASYPRPDSAVQGRYRQPDDSYAVVLRLHYASQSQAAALLPAMGQDASTCTEAPSPDDPTYHRVYSVTESGPDRLELAFREVGPGASDSTWIVKGQRDGSTVTLLYAEQRPGTDLVLPDLAGVLDDHG